MRDLAIALAIFLATLIANGCAPPPPEGLPDSDRFVYDVAPELTPAFEHAAARIEKASGIVLTDAPGGTLVTLIDESPQGSCGDTYVTGWPDRGVVSDVFIDVYPFVGGCYEDLGDTLLHELIHSLRRVEDLGHPEDSHSVAGVFTAVAWRPVLDETSLTSICEVVDCTVFQPEPM